jgi:hypothetical protein
MEREKIMRVFEAFFEKYKKTEGDRTAWSAVWTEMTPDGILELNLTKCPRGTIFKIFVDKKKAAEVAGWGAFFDALETLGNDRPKLCNPAAIFAEMAAAT